MTRHRIHLTSVDLHSSLYSARWFDNTLIYIDKFSCFGQASRLKRRGTAQVVDWYPHFYQSMYGRTLHKLYRVWPAQSSRALGADPLAEYIGGDAHSTINLSLFLSLPRKRAAIKLSKRAFNSSGVAGEPPDSSAA